LNFGFDFEFELAYIWYSNLGVKFVHYFHLVKIGNAYNKYYINDVVVFVEALYEHKTL